MTGSVIKVGDPDYANFTQIRHNNRLNPEKSEGKVAYLFILLYDKGQVVRMDAKA